MEGKRVTRETCYCERGRERDEEEEERKAGGKRRQQSLQPSGTLWEEKSPTFVARKCI